MTGTATRTGRGLLWVLGVVLAAILVCSLLILGWMGLVPGLSALMGANEARDLGVEYTTTDLQNVHSKSGVKFERAVAVPDDPTPPRKRKVLGHPKKIDQRFTQEELSAFLNSESLEWLPLQDIQLRLSDHTVELSGSLRPGEVPAFLKKIESLGYREAALTEVAAYAEKLSGDIPVYFKVAGGVQHAQLDLEIQEIEVGRLSLPTEILEKIVPRRIHKTLGNNDHFSIESAVPQEGSIAFGGILPSTIYLEQD
jgi:hypothetical protein